MRPAMLVLLLVLVLAACSSQSFDVARVRVVAPLSGNRAALGRDVADGVQLAVAQWNEAGGVYSLRLELVVQDSAIRPAPGRLPRDDSRVVLTIAAPDAEAVAAVLDAPAERRAAAVLLSDPRSAGGDGMPAGTVALAPALDQAAGIAVAAVAYTFGPTTVAVVASGGAEDIAAARAFVRAAPARGLQVRASLTLAPIETDYARVAATLRNAGAQVVYVVGRGYDAGALWAELRPRDSRARLVLGPGTMDEGFLRTGRGFLDNVLALELTPRPEDRPAAAAFVRDFSARFGRPPSALAARAYDAATLGLRAVAGATSGAIPPRADVRAALPREDQLEGVSASYTLANGAPPRWRLAMYRLDHDGARTLVGEPELP